MTYQHQYLEWKYIPTRMGINIPSITDDYFPANVFVQLPYCGVKLKLAMKPSKGVDSVKHKPLKDFKRITQHL